MLNLTGKGSLGRKSIFNMPVYRNRCFWNYPPMSEAGENNIICVTSYPERSQVLILPLFRRAEGYVEVTEGYVLRPHCRSYCPKKTECFVFICLKTLWRRMQLKLVSNNEMCRVRKNWWSLQCMCHVEYMTFQCFFGNKRWCKSTEGASIEAPRRVGYGEGVSPPHFFIFWSSKFACRRRNKW